RLLRKEEIRAVQRQVAVHFVGGYLVIPFYAVLAAGVHHHLRTDDIGLQEDARILDGTVHVALCRKVYNDIRFFLLKEVKDSLSVTDVHLHKTEVWIL